MKKLMTALFFILAGTNAFAMTVKVGDNTMDVYASVRAFTIFNHTDKGDVLDRNRSQFTIGLQNNSRMGVRWTQGNLFVHTEMGMGGDAQTPAPSLRLLYGDYKFAGGEKGRIRIGQIPAIANTHSYYDRKLSQDNGLQGYGTMLEARRVGINYEIGGFSISAISMRQDLDAVLGTFPENRGFSSRAFSEIMPRFEALYTITPSFRIGGSYVKSSIVADNTVTEEKDKIYSVDAGHIMIVANPKIGNNARLIASGFYAVNGGLYRMVSVGGGFNDAEAVNRGNYWATPVLKEDGKSDMYNTSVYGGALAVTVNAFEVGFGIQSAGNDTWKDQNEKVVNQTGIGIYANYKYRVSNFRITPEVAYLHSGDRVRASGAPKDTKGFQFGVQFRFDI